MTDTANLALPLIEGSQAQKHVTHNEAIAALDLIVQLAVVSRQAAAPPASPAEGARWIVAASPSGAWAGHAGAIAAWQAGGWVFYAPQAGWLAYVQDESVLAVFTGAAWVNALGSAAPGLLGINTTAALPNRLAVKSDAVLLAADDVTPGSGDMRLMFSKAAAARTAALMFQDAYSGRAEIGLSGDDDLHLKVSADGASWTEALTVDRASGQVVLKAAWRLAGAVTPSLITADQNDYAPAGLAGAARLKLAGDALRVITGLAGGIDGRLLLIENTGSFALVLRDASAASASANRFGFGADRAIEPGGSLWLRYDGALWRAVERMAAAPLDALAANGLQLNGGMEVAQETVGAAQALAATGSLQTTYVLDQVFAMLRGSFALSAQQVSDAPPGYAKSLKLTVTTAQASLGTSDEASLGFPIEGTRAARLAFGNAAAQPLSLAFWVKAHRTGAYSGSLRNASRNRSLAFSFAVNAADVWEYKTITLAGDATGTWANDAGLGLLVTLCVAAGTGRVGAAGGWSASDYAGASGTANGVAVTSDVFQVTGLVVLPGLELPSAPRAPLLMRPFAQELAGCERYYEKSYAPAIAPGAASQSAGASSLLGPGGTAVPSGRGVTFRAVKRVAPTMTGYSPTSGTAGKARDDTNAGDVNATLDLIAAGGFRWFATPAANGAVNLSLHWVAQARL